MVGENTLKTDVPPTTGNGRNRGFVTPEMTMVSGLGYGGLTMYRPFWRTVVAGALFAISVFALSWYLMLGCHVGVTEGGIISLGPGAAVWIWVTSCVAFLFGGMIAGAMSRASGLLKGLVIWGLSIPLALVIYAIAAHSEGSIAGLGLPHAGLVENVTEGAIGAPSHFVFYWSVFITLGCALIFSIIGATAAACGCKSKDEKSAGVTPVIPSETH